MRTVLSPVGRVHYLATVPHCFGGRVLGRPDAIGGSYCWASSGLCVAAILKDVTCMCRWFVHTARCTMLRRVEDIIGCPHYLAQGPCGCTVSMACLGFCAVSDFLVDMRRSVRNRPWSSISLSTSRLLLPRGSSDEESSLLWPLMLPIASELYE